MTFEGSITDYLVLMKAGDCDAAQPLWEVYFSQLVTLARARLRDAPRRAADEEDVALSAFDSFCRGVQTGRFPRLDDRDDLWQILVLITVRKSIDLRHHEGRQVRGGGRIRSLADLAEAGFDPPGGDDPGPDMAALVSDQFHHLMSLLDNPALEAVAHCKLESYTNAEIASRLGCAVSTVERKLGLIRHLWQSELGR